METVGAIQRFFNLTVEKEMTGKELLALLEKRNMKPIDLAVQLGVSVPTIYSLTKSDEISTLYCLAIKQLLGE